MKNKVTSDIVLKLRPHQHGGGGGRGSGGGGGKILQYYLYRRVHTNDRTYTKFSVNYTDLV